MQHPCRYQDNKIVYYISSNYLLLKELNTSTYIKYELWNSVYNQRAKFRRQYILNVKREKIQTKSYIKTCNVLVIRINCKSHRPEVKGKKKDVVEGLSSAKVTLIILYGFLDPQKHSCEPLVQP